MRKETKEEFISGLEVQLGTSIRSLLEQDLEAIPCMCGQPCRGWKLVRKPTQAEASASPPE